MRRSSDCWAFSDCLTGNWLLVANGRVSNDVRAPRRTRTHPATDAGVGLAPDTSAEAISERAGLLDPTREQAEAFWREHELLMLPPDGEP